MAVARHFVGFEDLGDTPNIVVDGAGNAATVLTLSHWPKSGTPKALKADSSAEIVFNFLATPEADVAVAAVSNNHFDEDGLVGVYALIEPEAAQRQRDLLVEVATAGDFSVCRNRQAARIAFTISAFANARTSPLEQSIFSAPYPDQCAALYREMLPRVEELLSRTDDFRSYWEAEDERLTRSERALGDGTVTIEEVPGIDLAVVRVNAGALPEGDLHPMAVCSATQCNRILTLEGARYDFTYRYESWVQFMSRPVAPRVDLTPLAEALTAEETGQERWDFEGVSEITPHMRLSEEGVSTIPADRLVAQVAAFLETAPAAWDPYDPS